MCSRPSVGATCTCMSHRPGSSALPPASMRSACDGIATAPSLPTARMRLPSITTVLPGIDWPVAESNTFAFVIATGLLRLARQRARQLDGALARERFLLLQQLRHARFPALAHDGIEPVDRSEELLIVVQPHRARREPEPFDQIRGHVPLVRAFADVQLVGALDARLARGQQRHALPRRFQQGVREPAELFRQALRAEIERAAGELLLARLGAVLPARDAIREREALRDRRLDVVDAVHLDRDRHAGGIESHARGELRPAAAIVELVAQAARAVGGDRARLHARGLLHDQDRVACLARVLRKARWRARQRRPERRRNIGRPSLGAVSSYGLPAVFVDSADPSIESRVTAALQF